MSPTKRLIAQASAPAHITGFFEICEHDDIMKKGSTGCGVVLDRGVRTTVTVSEDIDMTELFLNGFEVAGETSKAVAQLITERPVRIESLAEIPIGCGFGASGAGALGTAYALNKALSMELTANQLNDIAHVAEVSRYSGLGDVTGQIHGGIVIRRTPGAPSTSAADIIPSKDVHVYCVALGEMPTESILSDPGIIKHINEGGKRQMKRLIQKPTIDNFMLCSRDFTIQSGLAGKKVTEVIEASNSIDVVASQAMLGNAVFAIPDPSVASTLEETFMQFGKVLKFKVMTGCIKIS